MEGDFFKSQKKKSLKKNKYDIYDINIWEQNIGSMPVNLPFAINNKNKAISAEHAVLYSDNRAIYANETVQKRNKVDKNKKIKLYKYIKDNIENLLIKTNDKINFMKNENKVLQKKNCLSLQKTAKCYFQTNRPKTSKFELNSYEVPSIKMQKKDLCKTYSKRLTNQNLNLDIFNDEEKNSLDNKLLTSRNLELYNIYTNENTKEETNPNLNSYKKTRNALSAWNKTKKSNLSNHINQSKFAKSTTNNKTFFPFDIHENKGEEKLRNLIDLDVEKLYATSKRKKLNLSRINEIYRVQMNKSLKKYDPETHLRELNKIQLNDIKVRKSMEKVKGKMNKKINDRCQGQYYKKEYLRFKEENEKDRKWKAFEKKSNPIFIPFNIYFKDDEKHKNVKVFKFGYKKRAYYDYCERCERIQKSENKDLMKLGADLLFRHMNKQDHDLLGDSLNQIFDALEIKPIMKYIDDMKNEKVNRDKNALNERFKKYFPVFTEAEKILQQIEKRKIIKEKKFDDSMNIIEKIHETKDLLKMAENEKFQEK